MSNPENYIAENPTHKTYPSENFIKRGSSTQTAPDSTDVLSTDMFKMLSTGLRLADIAGNDILSRFFMRPNIVNDAVQQKAHKLGKLSDPSVVPDVLLQHMRTIVGFGEGTGLPDKIYDQLDFRTARKLIRLAVPFWQRRGRRDAIEDLVFTLTGVRPLVVQWFESRNILDEVFIGVGVPLIEEFTAIFNFVEEVSSSSEVDGDVQVHIRIADSDPAGDPLDKTLVKDMLKLCRPLCERYSIAYVDFLDTIIDGRLGHWRTVTGTTVRFEKADHKTAEDETQIVNPRRWLPRLRLLGSSTAGGGDVLAVETPKSSTWASYVFRTSICQDDSVEPWVLYVYADPDTISGGTIKGYAAAFFPALNLVSIQYSDGAGVVSNLGTGSVDLTANKSVWRAITVSVISTGSSAQISVATDGELIVSAADSSNLLTSGTVAISAELMANRTKELGLGASEVYELPIETDKILPVS